LTARTGSERTLIAYQNQNVVSVVKRNNKGKSNGESITHVQGEAKCRAATVEAQTALVPAPM